MKASQFIRENPRSSSKFFSVLSLCLVFVSTSQVLADEDNKRGLKSAGPIKPSYDSPRFQEDAPEPLDYSSPKKRVLPEAPQSKDPSQLSQSVKFWVNEIKVAGCTVISETELQTLLAPYVKRQVSIDEIQALRQQLSMVYFQRGYVNSGVVIPDQDIKEGVVTLSAIEGSLRTINLSGNDGLFDYYLLDRIGLGVNEPLNVNELQRALRGVQQNPLIRKINAQLKPGKDLGVADLDVSVTEADIHELRLLVDNYRSPSIGAEGLIFGYSNRNLSGMGDYLSLSSTQTEGSSGYSASYWAPISANNAKIGGFYSASDSEVVEEPFDQINIESESSSYGLNLSLPMFSGGGYEFTLSSKFTVKESDSFLLGEPFSFSAGAIEGKSKTVVVDIGGDFIYREAAQVFALSLFLRKGLDALSANANDDDDVPDGVFISLLGQTQYARRLASMPGSEMIIRGAFQKSLDPLLSSEKFAVGGHSTVRGYRENQLVRDNGLTASMEFRWAPFADEFGRDEVNLSLVPFIDAGAAWDEDVPSQDDSMETIFSTGLGLLWQPISGLYFEGYWGQALEDEVKSDEGNDLQDSGLHFSLGYSLGF